MSILENRILVTINDSLGTPVATMLAPPGINERHVRKMASEAVQNSSSPAHYRSQLEDMGFTAFPESIVIEVPFVSFIGRCPGIAQAS